MYCVVWYYIAFMESSGSSNFIKVSLLPARLTSLLGDISISRITCPNLANPTKSGTIWLCNQIGGHIVLINS